MKKLFFLFVITFFAELAHAQSKFTLSGTITDIETGETMIGATVAVKEQSGVGTSCNEYGFYSLTLTEGNYTILVSYISYETVSQSIVLNANQKLNFKLKPNANTLVEVVVTAEKKNASVTNSDVGVTKLEMKEIRKIPVLFGEQDILKALTLTPGVKSLGEGNGGLYVRGGDNSQNLILLDEATVYNANHLLGFFSTFNSDAIKDVTLYKGTAPAEYGGRISSVLDVKMNDGNNQKFHVGGGIGLISSRLNVEGPIVKDKGSFLITGRRTYADLFLKLSNNDRLNKNQLYFYDINAKANYKINDNNRIYLSGYFGRDVIKISERFGIDWGNTTGTLRWNHLWSPKLFSNTSLIYSNYDYRVAITRDVDEFSITSSIRNINLKHEFQYYLNSKHTFNFGFNSFYHTITPGQVNVSDGSDINPTTLQNRNAIENAIFFSGNWKPNGRWNIEYGLRLSSFNLLGAGDFYSYNSDGDVIDTTSYSKGQIVKTYVNPEPRLNIAYIINEYNSVKISYTRNSQNLHLVKNSTSTTPTDIWIASSNNVKPEIGDQFSLGYFKNFKENKFQFSAETYYRIMQNQLDLKNGAEIRANDKIEGELLFGEGRAYGLELFLKKKYGKFNGWIGYTLSRTERKINGISDFNWYPARQDATHDISIVGIYDISKKWSVSATWVYNTGSAVTFPSGKYTINGNTEFYYTERNGYRMPDYHRLDLGATRYFTKSNKRESSLNFSLYNAYGRKNAYTIDFQDDPNDPAKTQVVKTYLFTFIPSITYNFKF
jgi:CarboxypepD_reg-like domain/TonB-dependent Receptor Plug Domain